MPTGFWLGSAKGKLGWRTEDKQEKKLFLLVPVRIAPAPVAANQGPKPLWAGPATRSAVPARQ